MPKLNRFMTKWQRYWQSSDSWDTNVSYITRYRRWRKERQYACPAEVERFKYYQQPQDRKWPALLAAFIGMTTYIVWDRIYQEARYLRNPGGTKYLMNSYLSLLYWRTRIFATIAVDTGININSLVSADQDTEKINMDIRLQKETLMKAKQIEKYKKERIDTFDFAYLGETEDFSITL